ncbi:MAG: DNA-binding transcriptional regulator [Pirellulaceae bacterium]|nr:DNA-binding transcriptional regulator [Pirellulaceae bacterium]
MKSRPNVALLIETSNGYARGVLDGVVSYVNQHGPWSIYLPEQDRTAPPPSWLASWRGDGIIARIETDEVANAVRRRGVPVVDVSAARRVEDIPWVETDDMAIAQLAADHLLHRGFKNLAFVGDPGFNWSLWREQHFCDAVAEADCDYFVHQSISRLDPDYTWDREKAALAKWLRELPNPVGIMACYDIKAQQVLDVCRELDLAVPEQVAVIGSDNDRLVCDLADPPLSSVIPNSKRAGYEAAKLLDRMMSGERVAAQPLLIEPLGVQTRQSTDILAIDDDDVATAVRFIRENALTGINVSDVLRHTPLSRRVLESRFRKILGRTPHEEIARLRIERIKQLLTTTDLTLAQIASRTGFQHVEYLTVAFKKSVGQSPSHYRRR